MKICFHCKHYSLYIKFCYKKQESRKMCDKVCEDFSCVELNEPIKNEKG